MRNKLTWADVERQNAKVFAARFKDSPPPEDAFTGKESELHRAIINDCQQRRYYVVHSRCDRATTQSKGVPDLIIAMQGGKVVWVEVKVGKNKLSAEQTITRHVLLALGHDYHLVTSFSQWIKIATSTGL
jgi:RecB family endonuclease NucS